MTPNVFSSAWTAVGPALGNHLWQSTLFAVIAWLLTLLWRKNQARARYWLWLAASLKFLVPFSLLIGLGSRLAAPHVATETRTGFYLAMEQVSQPFSPAPLPLISTVAPAPVASIRADLLPMLLASVWLCGLVVVLLVWCVRWRRVSLVMRDAAPLREGREVQALRRLEGMAGIKKPMNMLLSPASLEPGMFGIFRPVLLWPEG